MDRSLLKSRGRSKGSRNGIILAVVAVNLCIGVILYLRHAGKLGHANTPQGLLTERALLLQHIEEFNVKARASDPSLGLHAIQVVDSSTAQATAVSTTALPKPVSHETVSAVTTLAPASSSGGTYDLPDPNPIYRMRPAADVERENPELAALLKKHSKNNEIMLSLVNAVMICKNTTICWWNGGNILDSFLTILEHNKITNYLLGVMDDETEVYLKAKSPPVNWFRVNIKIPESQKKSHPANQVSTIKYTLLKTFLQLGYHVLITDMDLVYMKNPFDHLHRDADVEVQTDGFDDMSYGVIDAIQDKTMGWGGGGLYMKTFTTNVGCMWVKSNQRSFKLMEQVSRHLLDHPGWDQQVFNEYLLRPSHGDFNNSYAHLRVMDIDYWLNSKIFFRSRRGEYLPGSSSRRPTPVLVHMNYHPDKHKRMLCLMDRYFYNKLDACDKFPGGSEPNT